MIELTILVPLIPERGHKYFDFYMRSLKEWNHEALDHVQLILIKQDSDQSVTLDEIPLPLTVVDPQYPRVDGNVIWDTLASWRASWEQIRGSWVTTSHEECIWYPHRLRRTLEYLRETDRKLVMGNLRRTDHLPEQTEIPFDPERIEELETQRWGYWLPETVASNDATWEEDIFFARKDWLDSWRMPWLCTDMPYQDVYEIFTGAVECMNYGPVARMPLETHAQLHLTHQKDYSHYSPEVRDWFLSDPKWAGTPFANMRLWESLIEKREEVEENRHNMIKLRHGPGGTVTRYVEALKKEMWQSKRNQ
jgi:hypothetical protein